ncbi:hypothetical protein CRG98_011592 [Punica granatum]|uniref:Uncharacterized protein n=1 Tax=Punica granatum TaxID=22663 RepID=A0A2I0KJM8_PUNGR|nr:hypothetical protein CRG98_011592 [Punica granatum]
MQSKKVGVFPLSELSMGKRKRIGSRPLEIINENEHPDELAELLRMLMQKPVITITPKRASTTPIEREGVDDPNRGVVAKVMTPFPRIGGSLKLGIFSTPTDRVTTPAITPRLGRRHPPLRLGSLTPSMSSIPSKLTKNLTSC